MINDVRALTRKGAVEAVVMADLSVVLMHMNGEPTSMQLAPSYKDEVDEVKSFLLERAGVCETAGIKKQKIFIDPGFGFGKTLEHNLQLFRSLNKLSELGFPLVVGVSRKSMITKVLNCSPDAALNGTSILQTLAYTKGARIFRVHDVKEVKELILLLAAQDLH